jgi:hypothetical protein
MPFKEIIAVYSKNHTKPMNAKISHVGGVVVSVLATGPKGCGFKTRPRQWIYKGDKNPHHTFLSDGK